MKIQDAILEAQRRQKPNAQDCIAIRRSIWPLGNFLFASRTGDRRIAQTNEGAFSSFELLSDDWLVPDIECAPDGA